MDVSDHEAAADDAKEDKTATVDREAATENEAAHEKEAGDADKAEKDKGEDTKVEVKTSDADAKADAIKKANLLLDAKVEALVKQASVASPPLSAPTVSDEVMQKLFDSMPGLASRVATPKAKGSSVSTPSAGAMPKGSSFSAPSPNLPSANGGIAEIFAKSKAPAPMLEISETIITADEAKPVGLVSRPLAKSPAQIIEQSMATMTLPPLQSSKKKSKANNAWQENAAIASNPLPTLQIDLANAPTPPGVKEFCERHGVLGMVAESLETELKKRPVTCAEDLEAIEDAVKTAKSPDAVIMTKIKELQQGIFKGLPPNHKELQNLQMKFGLDEQAIMKLTDLCLKFGKDRGKTTLDQLEGHLERSNKPSALVMMNLSKLRQGQEMGEATHKAAPGSWLYNQNEKARQEEADKRREEADKRRQDRGRGGAGGRRSRSRERGKGGERGRGDRGRDGYQNSGRGDDRGRDGYHNDRGRDSYHGSGRGDDRGRDGYHNSGRGDERGRDGYHATPLPRRGGRGEDRSRDGYQTSGRGERQDDRSRGHRGDRDAGDDRGRYADRYEEDRGGRERTRDDRRDQEQSRGRERGSGGYGYGESRRSR